MSDCDYSPLKAALEKLTIYDVWQRLGLEGKPGKHAVPHSATTAIRVSPSTRMAGDGRISPPAKAAMRRTSALTPATCHRKRVRGC